MEPRIAPRLSINVDSRLVFGAVLFLSFLLVGSPSFPTRATSAKGLALAAFPGWTAPVNVSHTPGLSQLPRMALDASGNLQMVWADASAGNYEVLYASKAPGSAWSAPLDLSNNPAGDAEPVIVADGGGTLHVAWYSITAQPENIYYTARPPGGSWSAPVVISGPLTNSVWPDLAVGPDGTVHAVWSDPHNGNAEIWYSSKPSGQAWSSPLMVSIPPSNFYSAPPFVEVDSLGTVHVVFTTRVPSRIFYTAKSPGGRSRLPCSSLPRSLLGSLVPT